MIFFVTEKYLKDRTPVGENVDIKRILPFTETVADIRIQPLLGAHFYNDLLTKYNAENLNTKETELVKLIQRAVSWYAAAEGVYSISRPLTNKGIQQQDGENSSSVDQGELAFGMDHYKQRGAHYIRRISVYLKKFGDDFPEFRSESNKDSDLYPGDCSDDDDNYNESILVI